MLSTHQSIKHLLWALASVVLISTAQLLLKWGMTNLTAFFPAIEQLWQQNTWFEQIKPLLISAWQPLLAVIVGLSCYGLSMACWIIALKRLKLSVAYPLLSLSYVFVYFGAVYLPWLHEPFSWGKIIGILLILTGLVFLFAKKYES